MSEFKIALHMPIVPVRGDSIVLDSAPVAVVGDEYSRLKVGTMRFAVRAHDGRAFEVTPADVKTLNTTPPNTWGAVRELTDVEFKALPRNFTHGDLGA